MWSFLEPRKDQILMDGSKGFGCRFVGPFVARIGSRSRLVSSSSLSQSEEPDVSLSSVKCLDPETERRSGWSGWNPTEPIASVADDCDREVNFQARAQRNKTRHTPSCALYVKEGSTSTECENSFSPKVASSICSVFRSKRLMDPFCSQNDQHQQSR